MVLCVEIKRIETTIIVRKNVYYVKYNCYCLQTNNISSSLLVWCIVWYIYCTPRWFQSHKRNVRLESDTDLVRNLFQCCTFIECSSHNSIFIILFAQLRTYDHQSNVNSISKHMPYGNRLWWKNISLPRH